MQYNVNLLKVDIMYIYKKFTNMNEIIYYYYFFRCIKWFRFHTKIMGMPETQNLLEWLKPHQGKYTNDILFNTVIGII